MAKYTISDVAARAGVSKATVSRYLNSQYERMSKDTRSKIKNVIEDMGYVPNYNASALKSNKSHQIGVVVSDMSNVYSSLLIKGISSVVREYQDQILIADAGENPEQEQTVIKNFLSQNISGLVLQPARPDAALYQDLAASETPVVLADRLTHPLLFPCVTSNDAQSSRRLANTALAKGYRTVLVVTNSIEQATVRYERYRAFADACREAGIPISLLEVNNGDVSGIKQWLQFAEGHKPVIFAANGSLMMATLRLLHKLNCAVPETVGVCGYDDWNWGDLAAPPLSAVNQYPERIGREVGIQLEKMIHGEVVPIERTQIEAELNIRESL